MNRIFCNFYIMTLQEVEAKIKSFLIDELEVDENTIFPESKLKDDMGIGSLEVVDVVVFVEDTFGFKMDPKEFNTIQTMSQFCEFVQSHCA